MISKTAMLSLVKELRWKEVRDGLTENPDLIGVRDKRGRTWLHLACGVDITKRQAEAVRDSIKLAEILLAQNGADIDPEAEGATPLLSAVQWSRFKAAEELLKRGADPNYQDSKGMTALHCMLKKSVEKKYVSMFLEYEAKTDIKNKAGLTAAAIMVRKRDPDFRRMLQFDDPKIAADLP